MALTKNYEIKLSYFLSQGTDFTKQVGADEIIERPHTVENAYIKIDEVFGNKESITLKIIIYTSDKETIAGVRSHQFVPSVADNASNFIAQGYAYLKSLPEYADAIDC